MQHRAEMSSHLRVHRAVAVEVEGAHARFRILKIFVCFRATEPLQHGARAGCSGSEEATHRRRAFALPAASFGGRCLRGLGRRPVGCRYTNKIQTSIRTHTHTYYRSLSLTHSLTHTQTWMRSKQWQSHDQPRTSGPANTRLSFLRGAELPSCGRIRTRLMTTVALFCSRCMYICIHVYIHNSSMCVRARLCARACKHVAFVPASTSLGFRDQCLVFRVLGIRS